MDNSIEERYRKGYISRALLGSLLGIVLILSYSLSAHAVQEVSLVWDPNTDPVDGYKVFSRRAGQSYNYSQPAWQGTATTCSISGLSDGTTYYFVARAYNNAIGDSGDTDEVMFQPGTVTPPPTTAAISRNLAALSASSVQGVNASSQTFEVWNSGGETLSYSISDNVGWLACSVISGTSTGEHDAVTVTYSTSTMAPGTYSATITITAVGASDSPQTIPITLRVVESDFAPQKPIITSPYYGQVECDPLIHVRTEPFSDPDVGDSHRRSQWQISSQEDFSALLLDIFDDKWLTEFPVPHSLLDRATTYFVRVRFYDSFSQGSEWSYPVQFNTLSAAVDYNGNGIPDSREVDNTVDLNGDGIPDNTQPEIIKSAQTALGADIAVGVCKLSDSIDEIELLDTIHPSTILDKRNEPMNFLGGLCTYRLRLNQVGGTALVKLCYSVPISDATKFYIYDTLHGWQDFTQHASFSEDGHSVTLELQDGGYGDSDGVANGIIVDPGGVAVAETGDVATGDSTNNHSKWDNVRDYAGCFIATAAGARPGTSAKAPFLVCLLIVAALIGYVIRIRK